MHELYTVYQDYHKDLYRISEFKKNKFVYLSEWNWTCFFVYQLVNKVNKLLKHCLHLTSDNRRKEVQVKRSRSLSIYDYGHWIRR